MKTPNFVQSIKEREQQQRELKHQMKDPKNNVPGRSNNFTNKVKENAWGLETMYFKRRVIKHDIHLDEERLKKFLLEHNWITEYEQPFKHSWQTTLEDQTKRFLEGSIKPILEEEDYEEEE